MSALYCDDDGDGAGDDDGDDGGDGNSGGDDGDGDASDGDGDASDGDGSGMASAAWALYSTPQEISSRRPSGPL